MEGVAGGLFVAWPSSLTDGQNLFSTVPKPNF